MLRYQLSHWEWESFFKDIDVLIVGSGITGLSAAIHLKEQSPSMKVVVIDRGPLPIGASTRNAGFACFGSLSELLDDQKHSSREDVLELVAQRYEGLCRLRERYSDAALGYKAWGGYEIFRDEDNELYAQCLDVMEEFNADLRPLTGKETFVKADAQIPATGLHKVSHLLLNQAEGQLHTGQLMKTLLRKAQSLDILCLGGVTVTATEETNGQVVIHTDHGWSIQARQCLLATNGFAKQLLPELALKPARNQVLITEPIAGLQLQGCFHYDCGYVYFRNIDQRILLGGGRNQDLSGEETTDLDANLQIRAYLEQLLHQVILPGQDTKIDRWWTGIMGVGPVKKPIIREVGTQTVAAVRLGGMGVAIGTGVGEQAADLLLGKM
ncbi:MAG: NAD(P)/FAD-dependent oxidoreductase [Lewinella sp.]|jgi:glycine/D-amino acid oxidase-like deaminating enzyme|uniref:NAD(P)/FAD-dependent oxidoreductase n=1 Tax=Lewinella sp. TaxID=2004506 RepID=UPI003D6B164C